MTGWGAVSLTLTGLHLGPGVARVWGGERHAATLVQADDRAENSHQPIRRRERKMWLFKSQASAQRFLTTYAGVYNTFYTQRHLISRLTLRQFRAEPMLHGWRRRREVGGLGEWRAAAVNLTASNRGSCSQ